MSTFFAFYEIEFYLVYSALCIMALGGLEYQPDPRFSRLRRLGARGVGIFGVFALAMLVHARVTGNIERSVYARPNGQMIFTRVVDVPEESEV